MEISGEFEKSGNYVCLKCWEPCFSTDLDACLFLQFGSIAADLIDRGFMNKTYCYNLVTLTRYVKYTVYLIWLSLFIYLELWVHEGGGGAPSTRLPPISLNTIFVTFSYALVEANLASMSITLSGFRTYIIYVRNLKTVATPVYIYMYTDFAIEIRGRRLTHTIRKLQQAVFTCFRLLAAITQHVYQSEGK